MRQALHQLHAWTLVRLGRAPSCVWVQERLFAFCDWDLPVRDFRAVDAHLARCPACATEHADISELARKLHDAFPHPALREHDIDSAVTGIMAAARETEKSTPGERRAVSPTLPAFLPPRMALAGAFAAVLLSVLFVHVRHSGDVQPSQQAGIEAPLPHVEQFDFLGAQWELLVGAVLDAALTETAAARIQVTERLPRTPAGFEAWARREYPHVLWLHDVLRADSAEAPSWLALLHNSGELTACAWPETTDAPTCRPRWAAVQRTAQRAGFAIRFDADGPHTAPDLPWTDRQLGSFPVSSARAPDGTVSELHTPSPLPDHYEQLVASIPELARQILTHVAVSAYLLDTPEATDVTHDALATLAAILSLQSEPGCAPAAHLSPSVRGILKRYQALPRSAGCIPPPSDP